jgi:hypothetical protein
MRTRTKPAIVALLVLVALLAATFVGAAPQPTTGLAFHLAVTGTTGRVDPSRFDRLERPDQGTEVYVSRSAALVIKPDVAASATSWREESAA